MSYFSNFPVIPYDSQGDGNLKDVTNLLRRVVVRTKIEENTSVFDTYDVKEGETPEMLAHRLYGNAEYHWIIMLANERYDYYSDFPLSSTQLDSYINDKYTDPLAVKHYVDTDGFVVDSTVAGSRAVSYRDYEISQNEAKRTIRIVAPRIADKIHSEFRNLMGK